MWSILVIVMGNPLPRVSMRLEKFQCQMGSDMLPQLHRTGFVIVTESCEFNESMALTRSGC